MNAIQMRSIGTVSAILMASALPVFGQTFEISSISAAKGVVQVGFPARSDAYYFLHSRTSLSAEPKPTAALLGADATLAFEVATGQTNAMFFQVEQLPLTNTTSTANDGLPDGWKLRHGLDPLGPSQANQIATGYVLAWLQLYGWETNQAALPLAYFPVSSTTVVAGSTNVTIQAAFTKPLPQTGTLTYQLSGTALPFSGGLGDYVPPPGFVSVPAGAVTASISITLTPPPAVEINRTLLVAISVPANGTGQTYTITTNSSVEAIKIGSVAEFVGELTGHPSISGRFRRPSRAWASAGLVCDGDGSAKPRAAWRPERG